MNPIPKWDGMGRRRRRKDQNVCISKSQNRRVFSNDFGSEKQQNPAALGRKQQQPPGRIWGASQHRHSTEVGLRCDCVIWLFDYTYMNQELFSLCVLYMQFYPSIGPFSFLRSQTFLLPFVCGSIISLQQPHTHTQIIFKEPSQPGKAFPTYMRQAIDCDEIIFWQPPPHLRSRSPLWRGFWI